MSAFEQERIDAQASEWLLRVSEGALTPREARALAAWRAADPRHERCYRELEQTWQTIGAMSHLGGLAPPPQESAQESNRPLTLARRLQAVPLRALAAAVVIAAVTWTLYGLLPRPQIYTTDVAQLRELRLSDGSIVTLGPKSTLEVSLSTTERRVELSSGQAFFEIAKDPHRPFRVATGASVVQVLGTKFDVNRGAGTVRVAVLEGVVRLLEQHETTAHSQAQILRAGQRAEVETQAHAVTSIKVETASSHPGAWREGWLAYDDALLAELIEDIDRYCTRCVKLADPSLGQLRVTASFKANEIPAFLNALSGAIAVRSTAQPDGSFVLEAI